MTQPLELEGETISTAECVQVEGRRKRGGGRPRKDTFAPLQGDLAFAKNFLSQVMRAHDQPVVLRVRCAIAVLLKGRNNGVGVARTFYVGEPPLKPTEVPDGDDQVAPEPEPDILSGSSAGEIPDVDDQVVPELASEPETG
jgi:hypothetical protein